MVSETNPWSRQKGANKEVKEINWSDLKLSGCHRRELEIPPNCKFYLCGLSVGLAVGVGVSFGLV